ncbi:MAG: hypothetical protein K6T90_22420 [Leptolyngbyaceae cyanobacterium HOT.MB2.61]|jgi:hypothetical protein|nr:hypothetical protein [Leptolyngbyaceae cyanobacterium HOT.MB2.61]
MMLRRLGLILLAAIFGFLVWQSRTPAQSVANLQADLYNLRVQVNQLQAQVAQLSQRNFSRSPSSSPAPRIPSGSPYLSDRQMLDRLAILAIEAKDRLNALEQRVSRLEKRTK